MGIRMDEMDHKIIAVLRRDARMAISDMAQHLGMSRTTVRGRIERMQKRGDILGFSVIMKEDVLEDPVRGQMMIGIEGRGTERILRQLSGMPEVRRLHTTNGRWDAVVEIGTETLEQFDAVLHRVRRLDGVVSSETSLLLKTRKSV